jgi:hypothetical protein
VSDAKWQLGDAIGLRVSELSLNAHGFSVLLEGGLTIYVQPQTAKDNNDVTLKVEVS